jgi:VWFA-related protein
MAAIVLSPLAGNPGVSGASDTLSVAACCTVLGAGDELQGDEKAVNLRGRAVALAALVGLGSGLLAQQKTPVPDAPTPQAPTTLPGVQGPITPGIGDGETPSGSNGSSASPSQPEQPPAPPPSQPPAAAVPQPNAQDTAPVEGLTHYVVQTTEVVVPVTVKDTKGNPVAGLTWRDFTVYENNVREPLRVFSVDPRPISVAFVIDQTLPSNYMHEVNESMNAIQGALTPYDEAAVFTYTNGAKEWTGFTGAQGNRLPAVLSLAQSTGTDPMVPVTDGPLSGACPIYQNNNCADPNLQPGKSTQTIGHVDLPKEIHTLNDAILLAAKELSTRPKDRLRVIYVISDGKEYGSKATEKEVVKYLLTNNIAVYATVVGESARWGEGWLDRFHLPFEAYDNILYKYVAATGGDMFSERGVNNMEKSYAKIADEARNQYTLVYASHLSIYDDRYRNIDVRVNRPNVVVTAKPGYYPSAQEYK